MKSAGEIIKEIREEKKLSQRRMAEIAGISFRQIQRLENSKSDITLKKFQDMLNAFGLRLAIFSKEPDWNALVSFGLPIDIKNKKNNKYKYSDIEKNIIIAARFLIENRNNLSYQRHYDAFKGMLLALKTHYPSRFDDIEKRCPVELYQTYKLERIKGRHIKLRNICLAVMSAFFRNNW